MPRSWKRPTLSVSMMRRSRPCAVTAAPEIGWFLSSVTIPSIQPDERLAVIITGVWPGPRFGPDFVFRQARQRLPGRRRQGCRQCRRGTKKIGEGHWASLSNLPVFRFATRPAALHRTAGVVQRPRSP
jgi:hypothetical protein